jgi:hypothetical protein
LSFIINSYVLGGMDADAQSFLTAASITDDTIESAVDTLVKALKAYGIWSKCLAIYPFVGGTSSTHKYNLVDPQDTDGAFRLTFNGGWTHASTGALPNGSTGYADTHFVLASDGTNNDSHLSFYSRTNGTSNCDIGAATFADTNQVFISFTAVGGNFLCDTYAAGANRINVSAGDSLGMFLDTRRGSTDHEAYKDGSSIGTDGSTGAGISNITYAYYIGARNFQGTADSFSNHECSFASIGAGLTDTEAADFYTAVQAFQTTLSRNV